MAEPFDIDLEQNAASLKINKVIYIRILSKALGQTFQDILDLESALPVEDFTKVQSISHRLKGDYDNMRIKVLSGIAKEMNEISRTGPDKERLTVLLDEFKTYFEKLSDSVAGAEKELSG